MRHPSKDVSCILEHRLKSTPADLDALEAVAVLVATSSEVIRNGATMTDYYWKEVAFRLVPRHAQAIVAAIFREQADRTSETWFAEYSTAKEVLWKCVELDPAAVWQAFLPYLSSVLSRFHFAVGFPLGLLDRMPVEDVLKSRSTSLRCADRCGPNVRCSDPNPRRRMRPAWSRTPWKTASWKSHRSDRVSGRSRNSPAWMRRTTASSCTVRRAFSSSVNVRAGLSPV